MKIVAKDLIPKSYPEKTPGLIAQGNLRLRNGGSLRMKVVVFDNEKNLQKFFADVLHRPIGRHAMAAVSSMSWNAVRITSEGEETAPRLIVPRGYFCIVGLCRESVTMRVLTHEAVHIGYCHAKRYRGDWQKRAADFDEEQIAYPAGEAGRELVNFLERAGVYERVQT